MKRKILGVLTAVATLFAGVLAPAAVFADNEFTTDACSIADAAQKEALGCNQSKTAPSVVTGILQGVISIMGILAVVMIIVGGQRYMTANGDPQKVAQAKNIITWSLVGLIIAMLAFAIVTFISSGIAGSGE